MRNVLCLAGGMVLVGWCLEMVSSGAAAWSLPGMILMAMPGFAVSMVLLGCASPLTPGNSRHEAGDEQLSASLKEISDLKAALNEHAIVAITDSQGRITHVNDKFCAISQYARAELLGQDHRITNSRHHAVEFIRDLWTTISHGKVWHGEIKNRAKDGTFYWVDTTISPFLDELGQPRQYLAISTNITERKRAETAFRESEELFSKAFRMSPDCVVITRASDRTVVRANEALCELWGSAPEEIVGRPTRDDTNWLDEKERRAFNQTLQDQGECLGHETVLRLADGRLRNFNISSRQITFKEESCILTVMRDTTEIKRANRALGASELRYRRLFETAKEGILILDAETGRVVEVNPFLIDLLGFSHEQFLGKAIWDLGFFGDIVANENKFSDLRSKEYIRYANLPLQTFNGRRVEVEFISCVYLVEDCKVIQCNIRDITARVEAERVLREREADFRTLAEVMPQMVWITHADGSNIYFNQKWMDYTGLTLEESLGDGWNKPFHPEDRQRAWEAWQQAIKVTGSYAFESRLRRADGVYRWWWILGAPVRDAEGTILKWFGTCTDITERKTGEEAAQHLATIVQSSEDAIIGKNLDGVITSWNAAAEEIFGYSAAEMIGQNILGIIPSERKIEEAEILAHVRRGESTRHLDTVRVRKDGTLVDVSITTSAIKDRTGRIIGASKIARDISARKRTERLLKEQSEQMRLYAEHSPAAVAMFDRTMTYLVVSRRWREDYHIGDGPIIGRSHYEVFPEISQRWRDIHQQCLAGATAQSPEDAFPRADGTTDWIRWEIRPWRQADGAIGGIIIFSEDITARKRADAALQASESRYRTLFEYTPEGIVIADPQSYYLDANPSICRMLGYTREELIGLHASNIVCPEELPHIGPALSEIKSRADYNREWQFRRKNGSVFAAEVIATQMPDGNFLGAIRDITERKQAEEKIRQLNARLELRVIERTAQLETANAELRHSRAELNSLFESLPGLYLVLTPELTITAVSDAYLKATLTRREDILGRGLFEVFPDNPNDPDANGVSSLRASLERVIQSGGADTMAIQKYDIRRPDGVFEEHYWSPVNSPVLRSDRQLQYIVHRVEDVTAFVRQKSPAAGGASDMNARMGQMEAEIFASSQKVALANRQLESANKELEAFSYSVSHDLRAPLRAVNGFAKIVLDECGPQLDESGRKYLERIRDAGQRMGDLIDDLLSFSRLGRQTMSRRLVPTVRLVQEVLNELLPPETQRQIEVKVGELPACQGDKALLKQVWINLVSNAIKYSRQRERAVIEIGCETMGNERVYFVRDNGTGFDMQYAHKLFRVFQRLHRADEYEGTGVGLAIVQRIVSRHGGRIWAAAAEGRGAIFYFTLEERINYECNT